jgi:hypothetical protein
LDASTCALRLLLSDVIGLRISEPLWASTFSVGARHISTHSTASGLNAQVVFVLKMYRALLITLSLKQRASQPMRSPVAPA